MQQQLDLIDEIARMPVRQTPRERGERAAQACAAKAARVTTFDIATARQFVLEHLAVHGASWGEDIVDSAVATKRASLAVHDGRAWGPVFAGLSRANAIRCLRADGIRKHGNATTGARQWALVVNVQGGSL